MPYIPEDQRTNYDRGLDELAQELTGMPKGHLTYVLYQLMGSWVEGQQRQGYQELSDAIAAAQDAGAEFRRMELDPYEDGKQRENGQLHFSFSVSPEAGDPKSELDPV